MGYRHSFRRSGLGGVFSPDQALGESIGGVHKTIAMFLLALIALHVSGALYHALVKRDGVIRRMIPG